MYHHHPKMQLQSPLLGLLSIPSVPSSAVGRLPICRTWVRHPQVWDPHMLSKSCSPSAAPIQSCARRLRASCCVNFFFCTTCWHDPCKAHLALRFFNVIIFDTICWKHIILWNLSCVSTRTLFATYAQAASRHLSTMPFLIDSRTAPLESIQKHLRSKLPQICRFLQGDGNFSPLELILYNKLPSSWYFSNSNSP